MRNASLFYKLFLIDTIHRSTTQLCPFVKSGIMHKDFTPFLRPDGMGIDYSHLEGYDTRAKLEAYLLSQHPHWKKFITTALQKKDIAGADYGLLMAGRYGLDRAEPDFIADARKKLSDLRKEKGR